MLKHKDGKIYLLFLHIISFFRGAGFRLIFFNLGKCNCYYCLVFFPFFSFSLVVVKKNYLFSLTTYYHLSSLIFCFILQLINILLFCRVIFFHNFLIFLKDFKENKVSKSVLFFFQLFF